MSEEFEFEAALTDEEESEYRRSYRPPRQAMRVPRLRRPLPRPRPWPRPRRRRPVPGGWYPGSAPAYGIDFIRWVQQCLAAVLGRGVPRNGVLGPATRRAVRIFQKQQGLRATGIVDPATENALRNACSTQLHGPAPAPLPAEPVLAPEPLEPEPEPADAGPEEPAEPMEPEPAASEPADAGDDADAGEFRFNFEDEEKPEREFQVSQKVAVAIVRSARIPVAAFDGSQANAKRPGIYIIYVGDRAWYVGLAERSIYSRFQDRFKALSDFDVDPACLSGRAVEWITIAGTPAVPSGAVGRRAARKTSQPYRSLSPAAAVLPLLEQFYIKDKGTREIKVRGKVVKRGGNKVTEKVNFVLAGELVITEAGQAPRSVTSI
jgi:hypothetical protein